MRNYYTENEIQTANRMFKTGWRGTGTTDNFGSPQVANAIYPDAGHMTYHSPLFLADANIEPWDGLDWTVDKAAPWRIETAINVLDLIIYETERTKPVKCADCGNEYPPEEFNRCYMSHRHGVDCRRQKVDVCVSCELESEKSGQYA